VHIQTDEQGDGNRASDGEGTPGTSGHELLDSCGKQEYAIHYRQFGIGFEKKALGPLRVLSLARIKESRPAGNQMEVRIARERFNSRPWSQRDSHAFRQFNRFAAESFDNHEAKAGQGNDYDEKD